MKSNQMTLRGILALAALTVLWAGCADGGADQETLPADTTGFEQESQPLTAMAMLQAASGDSASGHVTFTQENGGVRVVAEFSGLPPGDHGFHVHENGDCSAPDFASAGGHFAPDSSVHGAREAMMGQRHLGDLGNLTADASGVARVDFSDQMLTLEGPNSIIGKAVLVHEKADDFRTQPSGDSGARILCGVIQQGSSMMSDSVSTGATP